MEHVTGVRSEVGQLFRDLVELLVDCPDNVRINELPGASSTILEVVASGGEFGRIVGKRGRLADALREIARCLGWRERRQFTLDIVEGDRERPGTQAAVPTTKAYDTTVKKLLERVIRRLVDTPTAVEIDLYAGKQAAMLEVTVELLDTRRLIGRGGAFADALRVLLQSFGARRGRHYYLEIVEPIERVEAGSRTTHGAGA